VKRIFPGLMGLTLLAAVTLPAASAQIPLSAAQAGGLRNLSARVIIRESLQSKFRFKHVTSADGLSNDSVFSILEDRRGFMWFGTQGGLDRYDGYRVATSPPKL